MKKSILNLGKALEKGEQKKVNGGSSLCHPERPKGCTNGVKYILQGSGCWVWFCETNPGSLPIK